MVKLSLFNQNRIDRFATTNFGTLTVNYNSISDHVLASAATNGAVVTWNLNKSSRSKQGKDLFTLTVNVTVFVSNSFDLFNIMCE